MLKIWNGTTRPLSITYGLSLPLCGVFKNSNTICSTVKTTRRRMQLPQAQANLDARRPDPVGRKFGSFIRVSGEGESWRQQPLPFHPYQDNFWDRKRDGRNGP